MAIVVLVVIIIIIASSSSKKGNDSSEEEEKRLPSLGEISCIFEVQSTTNPTSILSSYFEKETNFGIEIDGKLIRYEKEHKFEKSGHIPVKFLIYESIKMDFMFKNILALEEVKINSKSKCSIYSL